MSHISHLIVGAVVVLLLAGCQSQQSRPDFEQPSVEKIQISPSKYFEHIVDSRPEHQKTTYTEQIENTSIQFIGDDAFSRSPLHQVATSLSTWLRKNPDMTLEVTSLFIHYGDETKSRIVMNYKPSTTYFGYGPLEILVGGLINSDYQRLPGGYNVVVKLYVRVDGRIYFAQHVQRPVSQTTQTDLISAALDFTCYKLGEALADATEATEEAHAK